VISAIVPVKDLPGIKSRLRVDFAGEAVERLATAMLLDVVDALRGVPELRRVVVVTPDTAVAEIARAAGADVLLRDDDGLNAAVDAAAAEVAAEHGDGVLVVLGDVAGARSEEIAVLLRSLNGDGVALAESSDGGTAALLRVPHDVIAAGFGPESAAVHRRRAHDAGARFVAVKLPSLAVDVDRRADLETLLAGPSPAPHTRAVWAELVPDAPR
jgi:2-phospho-L-lactate guanylyltransferase